MARLGDICDVRDGTHDSPPYVDKGYPLVTSKNIVDGNLDLSVINHITLEDYNKINERSKVDSGDIIMPMIGTIGNPYLVGEFTEFAIKNVALIKFNNEQINNKYIYYFLNSNKFKKYIAETNRGGTQKFLSLKDIRNMEVNIASLDKQLEIVEILDKISGLIYDRKQQVLKLDELVKSRFIELFGDPIASKNKRKLSEIGRVFTGNTPSMKKPSYYESNDIPFIKPSDLNESGVTYIDGVEAYVSEKARPVARIIPPQAVLVTCIGTIGKIGITARESCCNQQINFIMPNDRINSVYLAHCLTFFKSTLQNIANAPVVPIINKTQFSELEIPVFEVDNQQRFAAFVEQTDKSKLSIQKSLEKLETLKKALMQQYFG